MASNYDFIRKENIRKYGEESRHLAFLGRLYSDRTHFVYELLQNAEDKDATRIQIVLYRDRLELLHDGTPFDEADICGICGVGEGTKSEDLTKIGKFGIGFKSVYAYSSSPEIHCEDEHFRIEHYVRPHAVGVTQITTPWTTKFIFPFDTSSVSADVAFDEIAERLASLNVRTLLFLRNIDQIDWQTVEGESGTYIRESVSRGVSRQITVIGERKGEEDEEESWLVFEKPVNDPSGNSVKPVEIAYRLRQETEGKDKGIIGKAVETIVPLHSSPLFVFFATEKDTRLGFLIQGPYKTTPARDNIPKDDVWNTYLLKQSAALVIESLHHLKSMNLLNVSVLQAMPIKNEDFQSDSMFRVIYDEVSQNLIDEDFLPTEDGGYVSARMAKIGRGAEIRGLLSPHQLKELSENQDSISVTKIAEMQWLIGEITQERTQVLREYLISQLGIEEVTPESFARRVTVEFFEKQSDDWTVELYRFLLKQEALWRKRKFRISSDGVMRHKPFVRLEDNSHVSAFNDDGSVAVYLPYKTTKGLPCVKESLLADNEVREFFERLGVREPDVVSTVIEDVLPLYEPEEVEITEEEHADHINLILQACQVDSMERRKMLTRKLQESFFLFVRNAETGKEARGKPSIVYLRKPELEIFLKGNPNAWFLDERYSEREVDAFKILGAQDKLSICRKEPDRRDYVIVERSHGSHKRGLDGFDPGCWVEHLDFATQYPNKQRSLFIWEHIARPLQRQIRGVIEESSRQSFDQSETEEILSKIGCVLLSNAWLPNIDGEFHNPKDLSLRELPSEFEPDEGLASQLRMKGSELMNLARKAGLDVGDLDLIRQLKGMPEEFQHLKQLIEKRRTKPAFPGHVSHDPDRRLSRAKVRANEAPGKEYEKRSRNVRVSSSIGDKVTYLRQNYTNEDSELICQMCEEEMPFRGRDNEYYFEAVQLFDDLAGEHVAVHIAFCPLCAAKFKELVKRDEKQRRRLRDDIVNSEELRVGLKLGKEVGSIRFVEKHLLDIQGIMAEENKLPDVGNSVR